jgi:hypothetical protein
MVKTHCETCDRTFKNEEALEHHNKSMHTKQEPKSKVKTKKIRNWTIAAVIFGALILLVTLPFISVVKGGEYETFSQCLSDSGVKMYGAYWCSHCIEQKSYFGNSFKKVNYIECSLPNRGGQNQVCNSAGIESYPTWEFSDGTRLSGAQALTTLSDKSGCPLIKDE